MSDESTTTREESAPAGDDSTPIHGAAPFLQTRGLTKRYPGVLAVDRVDLDVHRGEVVGLVGKNGAGKSTLIKMLAGAVHPGEGEIRVDGEPEAISSPHRATQLGLAFVHQELADVPNLSVAENVQLGLGYPKLLGFVGWKRLRRRTQDLLDELGTGIDPRALVGTLSIAEQRLVTIARGLAVNARLLVLDEPSASLSDAEIEHLHEVIRRFKARDVAVIYISHRLDEVFDVCDRVVVMRDARVVADEPVSAFDERRLIAEITGAPAVQPGVYARGAGAPRADAEEVLRVEGLSAPGVVRDASFSVRRGELLGIAGLVGAGRTELVRLVFGADRRTAGRILVHGRELDLRSPADALRAGIVLLPEDRRSQGAVLDFSIRKNITLATLPRFRLVSGLPFPGVRRERAATRALMERLSVRASGEEQPVRLLSGGNQQKVVLAKWLQRGADVLIFDEATHGIDVQGKEEVYALMREFAAEGKGVVFISSEFSELVRVCSRIMVMREGMIVDSLEGEEITEGSIVARCYAADAAPR